MYYPYLLVSKFLARAPTRSAPRSAALVLATPPKPFEPCRVFVAFCCFFVGIYMGNHGKLWESVREVRDSYISLHMLEYVGFKWDLYWKSWEMVIPMGFVWMHWKIDDLMSFSVTWRVPLHSEAHPRMGLVNHDHSDRFKNRISPMKEFQPIMETWTEKATAMGWRVFLK